MKELYKNRALCVRMECELANVCARAIAFSEVTDDDRKFMIVNPNLTTGDADCKLVATIKTERFARGFRQVFGRMKVDDAKSAYHRLMCYFGKNQYYDRRNGKLLISTAEQEYIKAVFAEYGCADEVFDGYEDREVWSPDPLGPP